MRSHPRSNWFVILVLLAASLFGRALAALPEADTCLLLTQEGKVEFALKGKDEWRSTQTNQVLHSGDRLRTGLHSRATLRWSELCVVRVDQLTSMEIAPPPQPNGKPQVELRSGAAYLFSREKPMEIQFRTPVASGAIRGTELNIAVADDGSTVVSLVDGQAELANAQGTAQIGRGEEGKVEPGKAPTKSPMISAINTIQWTLYYPAVVDPDDLGLSDAEKTTFKDSLEAYRAGDLAGALGRFPEGRAAQSPAEAGLQAALLLAAGRVEKAQSALSSVAPNTAAARAIAELIAAVKHQLLAQSAEPTTGSEWLARSYYLQSRGELKGALKAAGQAGAKSPNFGATWVRIAELEFGFGHTEQAINALDKGLHLSPRNAEGMAIKGFLLAAQNHTTAALKEFDQAIATDGSLANAWLGRGLLKHRLANPPFPGWQQMQQAGREDLEVAAALEPQRSLLRSYLGKAFGDDYDLKRAAKELGLAKDLDPADPTCWLYLALLDEQANKINQGIRDLETSKELNDNRSLFRSRLLLDQDQAVRGANLAAIYRDAGMLDRSAQEAARAVNYDYGNYSAHLFLANSFDALRDPKLINLRYETPWFSELLLANLLAPVGAGSLSQNVSQQDYSKLLAKDGLGVFSYTEYGSRGDWLEQGSQYGVFGNTSYSVDAEYRWQTGWRPNNDLQQLDLALRIKQQLTPQDSIFAQVSYFDSESGDVAQYYDQASASQTFRAKITQEPNLLLGYHHEWTPGSHTLFLFSRFDETLNLNDSDSHPLARTTYTYLDPVGNMVTNDFVWNPSGVALASERTMQAYSVEAQHIWQTPIQTLIVGSRYQWAWPEINSSLFRPADPNNPFSVPIQTAQDFNTELDRFGVYLYEHWQVLDQLRLSGGITYDRLHYPQNIDIAPVTDAEATKDQISPKAGITWTPLKDTNVRLAYSRSLGGAFFDQSVRLEPVQMAGFNQAFRSLVPESVAGLVPGTRFETFGAGVDQRFAKTGTYLFAAAEMLTSKGDRTLGILTNNVNGPAPLTPDQPSSTTQFLDFRERSLLFALNQLLGNELALGVRYKLTEADLESQFVDIPSAVGGVSALNQKVSATLHQLWLDAIYQHRCGFFGQFQAVWSQQSNRNYSPDIPGDDFWQYNVYLGYRMLQRRAEVRLGLLNLSDRDYKLNPLTLYNELPRGRTLTVNLKLNF